MKPRYFTTLLSGAAALVVAAGISVGAQAPAPPAKEARERKLIIIAPKGTIVGDEKFMVITNADRIELPDSDAVMVAGRIEWNREERWVRATGKPRMWDARNEVAAETMYADLKAKRLDIEGGVRMVVRPKEGKRDENRKPAERFRDPVTVTCDKLQYFYAKDTKRGTGTGHLQLFQKNSKADRTATGERLSYDGIEETVTLENDVRVSNTRGEHFECDRVMLNVKEDAEGFQMEGLRNAEFLVKDEEEEPKDKKGPPAGPEKKQPAPAVEPTAPG